MNLIDTLRAQYGDKNVTVKTVRPNGSICGSEPKEISPKGDVYDLPRGATPVDFAYAVHGKLGNQAAGAKVNGKMDSLDHKLQNGDVVEIIVDRKRTKPNHDWLEFVVTTIARREISKALKNK